MRPTIACALAALALAACVGKVEVRQDTAAINALKAVAPDTTSTVTRSSTDTTRRTISRPARIDHTTEQQKALQDKRLKRP